MPRGGARPGAGRKPKGNRAAVVLGMDGVRKPLIPVDVPDMADLSTGVHGEMLTPPTGLGEKEQAVWRAHAPLAITQGTLVPATMPGFREFCQLMVHQAELVARIETLGRTSAEADRLLRRWEK